MATFVLVHGAHHAGWCWSLVAPLLQADGHAVDALDLPGHGSDATPLASVTLRDNADCVAVHVACATPPVILVGHSLGGMAITQASVELPERLAAVVYVAGLLPLDGQSLADLPPRDPDDPVRGYTIIDEAAGVARFAEKAVREIFYGECTTAAADWAAAQVEPESLAAIAGRVDLPVGSATPVPRVYVECWRDRAIHLRRQRAMYHAAGCDRVLSIDTDHSPFLSRPQELAEGLSGLAARTLDARI